MAFDDEEISLCETMDTRDKNQHYTKLVGKYLVGKRNDFSNTEYFSGRSKKGGHLEPESYIDQFWKLVNDAVAKPDDAIIDTDSHVRSRKKGYSHANQTKKENKKKKNRKHKK